MSTADYAITAAAACYLATVGAGLAGLWRLAAQLRIAAPQQPRKQADTRPEVTS